LKALKHKQVSGKIASVWEHRWRDYFESERPRFELQAKGVEAVLWTLGSNYLACAEPTNI